MRIHNIFAAAVLAAAIGGLIVPAFAQMQGPVGSPPNGGMDQMQGGARMGHGMMPRSGMSRGMMQSMNGGDGRPNSQWHTHPGDDAKQD